MRQHHLRTARTLSTGIACLLLSSAQADDCFSPSASLAPTHDVGDGPVSLVQGDFDGDGDIDLVTANRFGDNVSIIINNGDGAVGFADMLLLLSAWGPCPPPPAACPADLDGDGAVGLADLLVLLTAWDG